MTPYLGPNHSTTQPLKIRISKGLSQFQIFGFPDFRSHSKSRPFANQPLSKSRLVWITKPHFNLFAGTVWNVKLFFLYRFYLQTRNFRSQVKKPICLILVYYTIVYYIMRLFNNYMTSYT